MRFVESSHTEVSGASEVALVFWQINFLWEVKLVWLCLIIVSIDGNQMTKYKQKLVQKKIHRHELVLRT